jgi:hypothetical protein
VILEHRRIAAQFSFSDPGGFGDAWGKALFVNGTNEVDEQRSEFYLNGQRVSSEHFKRITGVKRL